MPEPIDELRLRRRLMEVEAVPVPPTEQGQAPEAASASRELVRRRTIAEVVADSHEHTREVFELAERLATLLNNDRLRTAHFLLALTLTTPGIKILELEGLQRQAIRANCWKQIRPTDRPGNENAGATISENLSLLLVHADTFARERSRTLQIEDIVRMLRSKELCDQFKEYLSIEHSLEPAIETLTILRELKSAMKAVISAQPRPGAESVLTIADNKQFEYVGRQLVDAARTLFDNQKSLTTEFGKARKTINRTHFLSWLAIGILLLVMSIGFFVLGRIYH